MQPQISQVQVKEASTAAEPHPLFMVRHFAPVSDP
jgi:hypothetical protein